MHTSYLSRRTRHLSIQHVGSETLVYDEHTHTAMCLNAISAAVWNRCDGKASPEQIAAAVTVALGMPVSEDVVLMSLQELARQGLLESTMPVPAAMLSRRDMMVKMGFRAAMLVPVITAIAAPKAAQAYGSGGGPHPIQQTVEGNGNNDLFSAPLLK